MLLRTSLLRWVSQASAGWVSTWQILESLQNMCRKGITHPSYLTWRSLENPPHFYTSQKEQVDYHHFPSPFHRDVFFTTQTTRALKLSQIYHTFASSLIPPKWVIKPLNNDMNLSSPMHQQWNHQVAVGWSSRKPHVDEMPPPSTSLQGGLLLVVSRVK